VIAHRIAYLVDVAGVEPWRIVAVTFTNKAAREMRSRVQAHLAAAASELVLGTFHAICARLLRVEAERIGLSRSFNIFDDADQMTLMKRVVRSWASTRSEFRRRRCSRRSRARRVSCGQPRCALDVDSLRRLCALL
jgi:superfamily I DNA/RNA helicase